MDFSDVQVRNHPAGRRKLGLLPDGGSPGQVLVRDAGSNFESHWGPGGGSGGGGTGTFAIDDEIGTFSFDDGP